MRQKTINLYQFDELSEHAKEKAINRLIDINVDYDWFNHIYDDAERIGLKIKSFDCGYRQDIKGEFLISSTDVAERIISEHGNGCDTYTIAVAYLKAHKAISDKGESDETYDDSCDQDADYDNLREQFLKDLLQEYLSILGKEYDYLTSKESIIETIRSNEYEFTEDGKLA